MPGAAPQTSSTSTSTPNADPGDVLSAVVHAAGETVRSAAQMVTDGLSQLVSHYGSGSDDEGQNSPTDEHPIDVDAASATVETERMQALRDKWTASVFDKRKEMRIVLSDALIHRVEAMCTAKRARKKNVRTSWSDEDKKVFVAIYHELNSKFT